MTPPDTAVLDVLQRIESKLGLTAGISSVEIKTSARGVDVAVKAYAGSDVRPAGDAAVDEYVRVVGEIGRRLMGERRGSESYESDHGRI